jgi:hypothetical protein
MTDRTPGHRTLDLCVEVAGDASADGAADFQGERTNSSGMLSCLASAPLTFSIPLSGLIEQGEQVYQG